MKAGTLLLATYAIVAAAQPHRGHQHVHQHVARETVTKVAKASAVVYVDQNGNPVTTSWMHEDKHAKPTPHAQPDHDASNPKKHHEHHKEHKQNNPKHHKHHKHHQHVKPEVVEHNVPKHHRKGSNFGISYDPNRDNGEYKDTAEITADFQKIKAAGYSHVRSYRTDFEQVAHMIAAAKATGLRIFPGTSTITDLNTEVNAIINACQGNWEFVDSVGIGNELVNSGQATADQVAGATNQARGMLRGAGYTGPVVSPDTFVAYYDNPSLCSAGDYVAANCHAYFDGGVTADQAAGFVRDQHANVVSTCGGKHVRITESGWPSQGGANGAAVPSPENQATVIGGLKGAFQGQDITLFMAFDAPYKSGTAADYTGSEAFWGILS